MAVSVTAIKANCPSELDCATPKHECPTEAPVDFPINYLARDFESDLARSREILLSTWRRRPLWEKLIGTVAWILERQQ